MKGGDAFWQLEIVTLKWSLPWRTETINFFKVGVSEILAGAFILPFFGDIYYQPQSSPLLLIVAISEIVTFNRPAIAFCTPHRISRASPLAIGYSET